MIQPLQVKPQEELKRFWKQHLDGWTGRIGVQRPPRSGKRSRDSQTAELRVKSQIWLCYVMFTVQQLFYFQTFMIPGVFANDIFRFFHGRFTATTGESLESQAKEPSSTCGFMEDPLSLELILWYTVHEDHDIKILMTPVELIYYFLNLEFMNNWSPIFSFEILELVRIWLHWSLVSLVETKSAGAADRVRAAPDGFAVTQRWPPGRQERLSSCCLSSFLAGFLT